MRDDQDIDKTAAGLRERFRTAGQDDTSGRERHYMFEGNIERMDFAINAGFAYTARDQSRVLSSEV